MNEGSKISKFPTFDFKTENTWMRSRQNLRDEVFRRLENQLPRWLRVRPLSPPRNDFISALLINSSTPEGLSEVWSSASRSSRYRIHSHTRITVYPARKKRVNCWALETAKYLFRNRSIRYLLLQPDWIAKATWMARGFCTSL